MNALQKALANTQVLNAYDPKHSWDTRTALEVLMRNVTGEYFSWGSEEFEALKPALSAELGYACLFDFPHNSDESCKVEVICIGGKPAFLFHCDGDRSEYDDIEVVDVGLVREIAIAIFSTTMNLKLEALASKDMKASSSKEAVDEVLSRSSYLVNTYNGTFMVGNPRGTTWAFEEFARTHPSVFFSTEEEVTQVLEFKGWAHGRSKGYLETDADQLCVVLTAAGEVTIDSRNLILSLAKAFDQDHLQELKAAIYTDDFFVVKEVVDVTDERHGALTRSRRQGISYLQHNRGVYGAGCGFIVVDVDSGHEFRSGEVRIQGKLSLEHRFLSDSNVIWADFSSN